MIPQPQFDMSAMGGGAGGGAGGGMGGGWQSMMNPGMLSMFAGMFGGAGGSGNTQAGASAAAMPYLNQIGQQIPQYFEPYINAGKEAIPTLQSQYGQLLGLGGSIEGQYNQLMNNPDAVMNKVGSGFQQSPGYQFQTQQALGAANRAAAAGGMAGSPAEQQSIAGTVNGLANQDYYNYLNHGLSLYSQGLQGATGLYGAGLQGENDLAHMGLSASNSLTDDLMTQYLSQASDAYAGGGAPKSGGGSKWGSAASGALSGAATGSAFGPYGALIGGAIGGVGGYFSK